MIIQDLCNYTMEISVIPLGDKVIGITKTTAIVAYVRN